MHFFTIFLNAGALPTVGSSRQFIIFIVLSLDVVESNGAFQTDSIDRDTQRPSFFCPD